MAAALRFTDLPALTGEETDAWHKLRAANPLLDQVYFHPGFAAAVHASGVPVRVAVVRDDEGQVSALLPTTRDRGALHPVGWPGADFQGPIMAPGTVFPAADLLADGVHGFGFDHLVDGLAGFEPYVESRMTSPYLDITGGLDGYRGRISRNCKDKLNRTRRAFVKAEPEHGAYRFEFAATDQATLDALIELKREQYRTTGARDYFAVPERRDMLTALLRVREDSFGGVMSTIRLGETLVAAHFGLRADGVLHWWFPVYDPAFAHLSPGWMMLRELVKAGPTTGITRIELGRGDDDYKQRVKTGEREVCQGMVSRGGARQALRKARGSVARTVKDSPLGPGLREVLHKARALRR